MRPSTRAHKSLDERTLPDRAPPRDGAGSHASALLATLVLPPIVTFAPPAAVTMGPPTRARGPYLAELFVFGPAQLVGGYVSIGATALDQAEFATARDDLNRVLAIKERLRCDQPEAWFTQHPLGSALALPS